MLGVADMVVGIIFVLIVFLAKTKLVNGEFNVGEQLGLMIGSSLCVVLALFYRNQQVMGGNPNPITCYNYHLACSYYSSIFI